VRRPGEVASKAAASMTCSRLSSPISMSRLRRSRTRLGSGFSDTTPIPSADARAVGTNLLSARGAKSTTHTPSGSLGRMWSATANATEVLPIPPGPVMVIRRCCGSLVDNVSTTSARPNNRPMDSGGIGSGGASAAGSGSSVATTSPTKACRVQRCWRYSVAPPGHRAALSATRRHARARSLPRRRYSATAAC